MSHAPNRLGNRPLHRTGIRRGCAVLLGGLALGGSVAIASAQEIVWAVNVGGDAFESSDGINYQPEAHVDGGRTGALATVQGSQDAGLYRDYRIGDFQLAIPLDNGTFDVTFHFAEPEEIGRGKRVFSVLAEGQPIINDLDVVLFRDGRIRSALSVTAPGVAVADGELNVSFDPSMGEPVLSGLVVRRSAPRAPAWELVWQDEFNTDGAPDPEKWTIDQWPARKVNGEDQAYTARPKNLRVEDGHLIIEAHREDLDDAKYTSGRVHSSGKGDFLYGRFEVRARLPRGQGTWAAIWMLPSNPFTYATSCGEGTDWQGSSTCDAWPNSGEIDIMEHVGYQMNHVHGTVHTKAYYWINWEQRKGRVILDDVAEAFHVYTVEWSPERIDVLVDGTLYFSYVNEGGDWKVWPFDQPFHLIMNLAIGGDWGRAGGPIDDSIFPQRMLIDYARVYRLIP